MTNGNVLTFDSLVQSGMLFGMPDSFLRTKAQDIFDTELPEPGKYAVGNIFFPPGSDKDEKIID